MPPKRQTPEEKEKAFTTWKEGEEYKSIEKFMYLRTIDDQVKGVDNGYKDIWTDFQPVLNAMFDMVVAMKVPHKAKGN
jgi:hypothetical protein